MRAFNRRGESNADRPDAYNCQIQALVRTWRQAWHAGSAGHTSETFPFGIVQLAGCTSPPTGTFGFTALRWAQTAGLGQLPNAKMPNTFLATAYDLGDSRSPYGSVHIRWKQDVAHRLALSARSVAYGDGSVYAGPVYLNATLSAASHTVTLALWQVRPHGPRPQLTRHVGTRALSRRLRFQSRPTSRPTSVQSRPISSNLDVADGTRGPLPEPDEPLSRLPSIQLERHVALRGLPFAGRDEPARRLLWGWRACQGW